MLSHPDLVPNWLNASQFHTNLNDFLRKQQLLGVVKEFEETVNNSLLAASNLVFADALTYYNALKGEAKLKIPGAQAEYNLLKIYFKKTRKMTSEPTLAQVEQDVASLLHGTKEGKVVIENRKPDVVNGARTIVDEVETGKELYRSDTTVKKDV